MEACPSCGREAEPDFRFCPNCGMQLRRKVVEHFRGVTDLGDGWLRVSAYLTQPRHIRFSFWGRDAAQAVTSLDPAEARRLADFLNHTTRQSHDDTFPTSLRQSAYALRGAVRDLFR